MRALLAAALLLLCPFVRAQESTPSADDFKKKQALDSFYNGSGGSGAAPSSRNLAASATAVPVAASPAQSASAGAGPAASPDGAKPYRTPAAPPPPLKLTPVQEGNEWMRAGGAQGSLNEGDPSSTDQIRFNERLFNGPAFWNGFSDQVCRDGRIPLNFNLNVSQFVSISPNYQRYLHRGADGQNVLVDQMELTVSPNYGQSLAQLPAGGALSASVGATLDGTSMVIRPLKESTSSCKDLLNVIDLRTVKSALPLTAERMAAMQVGEIWNVPMVFTASISLGPAYSAGGVPISISFGYSREGGASVSVRRLDAKRLRVRVHIDYARVYGPSIGTVYSLAGAEFPTGQQDIQNAANETVGQILNAGPLIKLGLSNQLADNVWSFVNNYLTATFSALVQWRQEDHALIEFVLDPSDAAQLQGLQKLLEAGSLERLGNLAKLAKTSTQAFEGEETLNKRLLEYRRTYDAALEEMGSDARTFTGTDRIAGTVKSIALKLPFFGGWSWNSTVQDDHITVFDDHVLDKVGGTYDVYRVQKNGSTGFLNLPFVGNLVGNQSQLQAMIYDHRGADDASPGPGLIFMQMEGYTNGGETTARKLAVTTEEIMARVGARGGVDNPRTRLPADVVFPKAPPPAPRPGDDDDHDPLHQPSGPWYRRGNGTFTVAFSPQGVDQALAADPRDIVRAYVGLVDDDRIAQAMGFALRNGKLNDDGSVEFSRRQVDEAYPDSDKDSPGMSWYVGRHLSEAAKLAQRLGEIAALGKDAKTQGAAARLRAEGVRDLFKDADRYDLDEQRMLKLLIQFVDAEQIDAELTISAAARGKGMKDLDGRFLFRGKALESEPEINQISVLRGRFNKPSQYTD